MEYLVLVWTSLEVLLQINLYRSLTLFLSIYGTEGVSKTAWSAGIEEKPDESFSDRLSQALEYAAISSIMITRFTLSDESELKEDRYDSYLSKQYSLFVYL